MGIAACSSDSTHSENDVAKLNLSVVTSPSNGMQQRLPLCSDGEKCLEDVAEAIVAFRYVYLKEVDNDGNQGDHMGQCRGERESYHHPDGGHGPGHGPDHGPGMGDGNCHEHHIELKPLPSGEQGFRQIELLSANGTDATALFEELKVSPGTYQMCIYMRNGDASQAGNDSYVVEQDGSVWKLSTRSRMKCEGGMSDDMAQFGRLLTKPFIISEGENDLVIEFNLDKNLSFSTFSDWQLATSGYEILPRQKPEQLPSVF